MGWGNWERGTRLGVFLREEGGPDGKTVTAEILFESQVRVEDSSNTLSWTGSVSGSKSPGMVWNRSGAAAIHSVSWWVATRYGATQQASLGAWMTLIEYVPDGRLDAWGDVTIPARPYELPRRPPSVTVDRISDTSHTVAWTMDATGNDGPYPWRQVEVERWDNVSGVWSRIVAVGWDVNSYSDTSTRADRMYSYRVRALNEAGASWWTNAASNSWTTPDAHTSLAWSKQGSDVVLSWVKQSSLDVKTEIQESTDGGTTWGATLATAPAGASTWRHASPSTMVTHRYRVRPVDGGRTGAWTVSSVVQLLSPPLAPTRLTPASVTIDNVDGPVDFSWQHNAADGTSQTAYQLRWRVGAGAWTTLTGTTATTRAIAAGTWGQGLTVVWQVQTRGQHASWSPWSESAGIATGARPVVTIQSPVEDEAVGTPEMPIRWHTHDAEGTAQAGAEIEVLDGGVAIWTTSVSGAAAEAMPPPVSNGSLLTVRVRASDGSGLWSTWVSRSVTVDFVPPPTPLGVAVWDDALGAALITITNPETSGDEVDAQHNQVWRSVDGGVSWVLVAAQVSLGGTVSDRAALAAGTSLYRIVAVSSTPTTADSVPVVLDAHTCWVWVSGGPGLDQVARVKGDAQVSTTRGRPKKLHRFVGDESATEFAAPTARDAGWALSGKVSARPEDTARTALWGSWPAWETIADLPAPLLFRDPLGRRAWVSISDVKINTPPGERFASVSCSLTRVGGRD